jgi:hypothetical protein
MKVSEKNFCEFVLHYLDIELDAVAIVCYLTQVIFVIVLTCSGI